MVKLFGKVVFGRKTFKDKGFIGPIGDDLPSLIPIVVALVLFFIIFALTLTTYNSKNLFIDKQMNMTSVAREIKGDSLLLSIDDFQKKCTNIRVKKFPYNFMVGVYFSENDLSDSINDFEEISASGERDVSTVLIEDGFIQTKNKEGDNTSYACKYLKVGAREFDSKKASSYLIRYYPVAVQYPVTDELGAEQRIIVPAVMAMVVWE